MYTFIIVVMWYPLNIYFPSCLLRFLLCSFFSWWKEVGKPAHEIIPMLMHCMYASQRMLIFIKVKWEQNLASHSTRQVSRKWHVAWHAWPTAANPKMLMIFLTDTKRFRNTTTMIFKKFEPKFYTVFGFICHDLVFIHSISHFCE
jgi:hypothetical protein